MEANNRNYTIEEFEYIKLKGELKNCDGLDSVDFTPGKLARLYTEEGTFEVCIRGEDPEDKNRIIVQRIYGGAANLSIPRKAGFYPSINPSKLQFARHAIESVRILGPTAYNYKFDQIQKYDDGTCWVNLIPLNQHDYQLNRVPQEMHALGSPHEVQFALHALESVELFGPAAYNYKFDQIQKNVNGKWQSQLVPLNQQAYSSVVSTEHGSNIEPAPSDNSQITNEERMDPSTSEATQDSDRKLNLTTPGLKTSLWDRASGVFEDVPEGVAPVALSALLIGVAVLIITTWVV